MRLTKILLAAAAASALTLCAAQASAANLVTNGSFEDTTGFVDNGQGTMDLNAGATTMTGWTVTGSTDTAWIGPSNPFGLTASDGSYFLDLTGYSSAPFSGVTQTIATVAGDHYQLQFDLGSSSSYGLPDGITATAGATSQTFTSTAVGTNNWETETMDFVASGPTTLTLHGASGSQYIGLDNVIVTFVSSGTPEPATWAMMLVGFGGIGAAMRMSRRKVASSAV